MQTSHLNGSSEFISHAPCDSCGSSDGLAVYTDHTYCFVCHEYRNEDGPQTRSSQSTNAMSYKGFATRLDKRKLSEKTCERYKIYRDGDKLRLYYHDSAGHPIGCKIRSKNKDFTFEGASDGSLFGQHIFFKNSIKEKTVVITEGELDAASIAESQGDYPCVSLPNGAAAAKKAIKDNYQWLQQFEKVILWFDGDDPGRKAAKEAADVLPPGKAFIASLEGYKDASDALQANDHDAIKTAFWGAKPYRPDGIVEGKSLLPELIKPRKSSEHDYPFEGLNKMLRGIRYGEMITVTSGTGQGKSSLCRQLAAELLQAGVSVGYLPLEESKTRAALGLMSAAIGKSLHLGTPTTDELTTAFDNTMANWNLHLFDGFGSCDPSVIYQRIEYMAVGLECRVVFLDHLSILISGLDGDERRMIDQTVTRLRSLVERTGICLYLVSHLRRTQQDKNHEEGARVTLGQLRGSSATSQLSDSVIALERNQQSECEAGETTVRVLKNRYSGEVGVACTLMYNTNTCRFDEIEDFNATTDF